MWAVIVLMVAALMAPPKQQFNSWYSSPFFDVKGHCEYAVFVQGNVPYYWTSNVPEPSRMNDEPITGIDSQRIAIPHGMKGDVDLRIFLSQDQKYGEPTWSWVHSISCVVPDSRRD